MGPEEAAERLKRDGKGEWKFVGAVELPLPPEAREAEKKEAKRIRGRRTKAGKGG